MSRYLDMLDAEIADSWELREDWLQMLAQDVAPKPDLTPRQKAEKGRADREWQRAMQKAYCRQERGEPPYAVAFAPAKRRSWINF